MTKILGIFGVALLVSACSQGDVSGAGGNYAGFRSSEQVRFSDESYVPPPRRPTGRDRGQIFNNVAMSMTGTSEPAPRANTMASTPATRAAVAAPRTETPSPQQPNTEERPVAAQRINAAPVERVTRTPLDVPTDTVPPTSTSRDSAPVPDIPPTSSARSGI
jgi:hypothetical protein